MGRKRKAINIYEYFQKEVIDAETLRDLQKKPVDILDVTNHSIIYRVLPGHPDYVLDKMCGIRPNHPKGG